MSHLTSCRIFRLELLGFTLLFLSAGFAAPTIETAPYPREEVRPLAFPALSPAVDPIVTWRETATSLDHVSLDVSAGYDVLQSDIHVKSGAAFHLAHPPDPTTQVIELSPLFSGSPGVQLFFESRLGWATTDQVARVQIRTLPHGEWSDVWSQTGTNSGGEGAFSLQEINLSAFEDQTFQLRFVYDLAGQTFFPQTDPGVGWYIDDIQITPTFETRLYSIGDPTDEEQLFLEFINQARADAVAEATRLLATDDPDVVGAMNSFEVDEALLMEQFGELEPSAPPLAFNYRLLEAARLHSRDMLENVFQGHTSSASPPPPNAPGDGPGERVSRQGYHFGSVAENVFSHAENVWHGHAGFNIDWGVSAETGMSLGGMQDPPGHRLNIHDPEFREIGIGVVLGTKSSGSTSVGPMLVTQKLGRAPGDGGSPFITGVAWIDQGKTGFYSAGDGLGGITVTVTGGSYHAVTASSGGYALPVSGDGVYEVTFASEEFGPATFQVTISGQESVKLDYRPDMQPGVAPRIVQVRNLPDAGRIQIDVEAEADASLLLETSTDLIDWTALPHEAPIELDDGLYRFEPALNGPRRFYRIRSVSD